MKRISCNRNERKKCESREFYDRVAPRYDDTIYGMFPRKCYRIILDEVQQIPFHTLLDVGCGTGEILNRMAGHRENVNKQLYGVDLSNRMLRIARRKSNAPIIKYQQADAENLPFADEFFDVIICTESFHHYPNPIGVLREFKRVLKQNGTIIICDMYRRQPLRSAYRILMRLVKTGDVTIYSMRRLKMVIHRAKLRMCAFRYPTRETFLCKIKKCDGK